MAPSALECLHLAVFTAGLISGKSAPEWSIYVGWVFLVVGLLWRLRGLGKELDYWIAACREATFCIVAYYIDSVGVYMVAVMHERRFEHISLQDNVLLLLEYLCRSEIFDGLLRRLPELNADEAALYLTACCAFYASDGRAVQAIAKLARVMRYCRLLRVLCYCSTVIPSQNQACFVNRYDETYSLTEHWREAVTHMRAGGGCNDLIFSGHASVLTFCVLLYQDFGAPRWLQGFLWCRLAHASMRIVQSRSHLSVDIVVAFLLALLLYHVIPKPRKDLEVFGASSLRSSALAWSSALVAVLAFLAALLAQPDAGPLSTANQARLAQVSVAPNATASPRIFCAMLHIETSRQARSGYLKHGLSTWARHCDGAIFWDENREEIAALDAQSALGEPEPLDFRPRPSGLSHRWIRTRRLWRHIFRNEVEHYDWFVSFDDGGFPIVENIRHLVRDMNPQNAVMMSDRDRSAGFGSFMSRGALKLLGEALDKNRQCPQPTRSQPLSSLQAYGTLWQCLHDATRRVAWDVELRHLLRCKEDDHSILNLKASTARGVCPYALFAFMVPEPTWLVDIHAAIYRDTQLKQTP